MKKIRITIAVFMVTVSLYAVLGFIVLPKLVVMQLPALITETTGRQASLKEMDFNPFLFELTLDDFSMQESNTQRFVSFDTFFVDVDVWESLRQSALVITHIKLSKPYVSIEMRKDGSFNFSDVLARQKKEKPVEKKTALFPFIIEKIELVAGQLETLDSRYKTAVKTAVLPVDLRVNHLSSLQNNPAKLVFSFALDSGGELNWQGDIGINPVFSKGHLVLKDLALPKIWAIALQNVVNFKWPSGRQSIEFDYDVHYQQEKLAVNIDKGVWRTENLVLTGLDNKKSPLTLPYFSIEGIQFDLLKQSLHISQVATKKIFINAFLNKQGQLNIASLFTAVSSQQKSAIKPTKPLSKKVIQPWTIDIDRIVLGQSKVAYVDNRATEKQTLDLASIDINIKDYQLVVSDDVNMKAAHIDFSLQGGKISYVHTDETPRVFIALPTMKIGVDDYKMQANEMVQITTNNGVLAIKDFEFNTLSEGTLIKIPFFGVTGVNFNLLDKAVSIANINTGDGQIKSWLNKQGVLNYQTLFLMPVDDKNLKKVAIVPTVKNESEPWKVSINHFTVNNYELQFHDLTQKTPVSFNLSKFDFSVHDFDLQKATALPIKVQSKFNERGDIALVGSVVLTPFSSDMNVELKNITLLDFQPYINPFAKLDIIKGYLNVAGDIKVSQVSGKALDFNYQGDFSVKQLHARDQILKQDFLKWDTLGFKGITFDLESAKLRIKRINLDRPYARVTIKQDKTVNINDIFMLNTKTQKKRAVVSIKNAKKVNQQHFLYDIGEVNISDGFADFSDYSLVLPFVVEMNDLQGEVKQLSSRQTIKTHLTIVGKAFDLSPLKIEGEFQPNFDNLAIGLSFKSLPLPFVSPYMAEFAGYKIKKGKMSLDLNYRIKDRGLTAKNKVFIDQLELGESVESVNAADLPLNLAISLLKDKDGKIKLDMPLTGSLDDPEFSIAPILWDSFLNLVTKAIASPFKMLGAMLGSDDDFSVVSFMAGEAVLTITEEDKLQSLSDALLKKPALNLEINGMAYTNQDWPKMNAQALLNQLKQLRADELKQVGKMELAEYIKLSNDDYQRLLADLFIKTFPELAQRSIFGTPILTYEEMGEFYTVAENMLTAMIKPDAHKLSQLSAQRSQAIARYLIEQGNIAQERLFILGSQVLLDAPTELLNVDLTLKVQ